MTTALIWAPEPRDAAELVTAATTVGATPVVAVLGDQAAAGFTAIGATKVVQNDNAALKGLLAGPAAEALAAIAKETGANYVFLPSTKKGKEVASRLAVRLDAGCVTNASSVKKNGDKLEFERTFLGGKTIATEVPNTPIVVAAFASRLFEPATGGNAQVTKSTASVTDAKVRIVETKARPPASVDLENATSVVAVGRGFKNKDDLKLAFDLAQTVGGQVGCTRPLATDLGWLTDEYWIGLSGKEVKPKLYIAAGISGQIQHTTGIRASKVIVAINNNKDAPIFKQADYGIVGDLYKVLPALNAALKRELKK
ncbi:MAG TPA: electron transfer flavoprotein subunit alpha/FixB family protein [Candidatus Thermoplasmatota archaeon]|nr:electron transfer flavoprotein subunit alpha/FixB family protein [Candidatus Thermoplasmatota archaeon]